MQPPVIRAPALQGRQYSLLASFTQFGTELGE
jgi:hypothetical protein